MKTVILNLKPLKNTINRDHAEMIRLRNLVKRNYITKARAYELFQAYLKETRGREAFREFNYKIAA